MGYSVKYYVEHGENVDGNTVTYRVELLQDGFGGSATEKKGTGEIFNFGYDQIDVKRVWENPVQKGNLTLHLFVESSSEQAILDNIVASDEKEYQLRLKKDGSIVWTGYVIPDQIEYLEGQYPFNAQVTAKDLHVIESEDYETSTAIDYEIYAEGLAGILNSTGLNLGMHIYNEWTTSQITDTDDFFEQAYFDKYQLQNFTSFSQGTFEPFTKLEVLKELIPKGFILRQYNNVWKIFDLSHLAQNPTSVTRYEYDATGTRTGKTSGLDITDTVNRNDSYLLGTSVNKPYPGVKRLSSEFNHKTSIQNLLFESIYTVNADSTTEFESESMKVSDTSNRQFSISGDVTVTTDTNPGSFRTGVAKIIIYVDDYELDISTGSFGVNVGEEEVSVGGNNTTLTGSVNVVDADIPVAVDESTITVEFRFATVSGETVQKVEWENFQASIVNADDVDNDASINYRLTQSGDYFYRDTIGEHRLGQGPDNNSNSALRYFSSGATFELLTGFKHVGGSGVEYEEFILTNILNMQRTVTGSLDVDLWALFDADSILTYNSINYFLLNGYLIGRNTQWQGTIVELAWDTGSDTFEEFVKITDQDSGSTIAVSSGSGSTGNFDDRYLQESLNLSDLDNISTARDNLGLTDQTADLDLNSLAIGGDDLFTLFYTETEIDSFFNLYLSEADLKSGNEDLHFNSLQLTNLTENRVPVVGADGLLEDDASLTFDGTVLSAPQINTGQGNNELYPMDQGVRTTDDVTFNNLEVTGTINYVNENNLQVEDKTITVNKGGTDASAEGAGIIVERPSGNETLLWNSTDGFDFSDAATVTGLLTAEAGIEAGSSNPIFIDSGVSSGPSDASIYNTSGFGTGYPFNLDRHLVISAFPDTNRDLVFRTNNANRVTILGNGDVGIGTTSPTEALDVSGNGVISGTLDVGGVATFDDDLRMTAGDIETDNFSSWFSANPAGWQASYLGVGDFRTLYIDELVAKAFTADVAQALAGSDFLTKSVAKLAADFTVPAVGNTVTITVEDLDGLSDLQTFEAGDWIRFRVVSRAGGGLTILDVYGTVSGYTDNADDTQSWTYTVDYAGASNAAVGMDIYKGSIALDYGVSGDTFIERTVLDRSSGTDFSKVPYDRIVRWTNTGAGGPRPSATGYSAEVLTQRGNINGLGPFTTETYGVYAKDNFYVELDGGGMNLGRDVGPSSQDGIHIDADDYWYADGTGSVGNGILNWDASIPEVGLAGFTADADRFSNSGVVMSSASLFGGVSQSDLLGFNVHKIAANNAIDIFVGRTIVSDATGWDYNDTTGAQLENGNPRHGIQIFSFPESGFSNPTPLFEVSVRQEADAPNLKAQIAGWNFDNAHLFGGSSDLSTATAVVDSATPKLALGASADSIDLTTGTGFYAAGNGDAKMGSTSSNVIFDQSAGTLEAALDDLVIDVIGGGTSGFTNADFYLNAGAHQMSLGDVFSADGGADTGTLAGVDFDTLGLWVDNAGAADTFAGLQKYQTDTDPIFFAGADDKRGTDYEFAVFNDGRIFHDAIGKVISTSENFALFGRNSTDASFQNREWSAYASTSAEGTTTEFVEMVNTNFVKRSGENKLILTGVAKFDLVTKTGVTHVSEITVQIRPGGGAATIIDSFTVSDSTYSVFTNEIDISGLSDGVAHFVEVFADAEVTITAGAGDGNTYSTETFFSERFVLQTAT